MCIGGRSREGGEKESQAGEVAAGQNAAAAGDAAGVTQAEEMADAMGAMMAARVIGAAVRRTSVAAGQLKVIVYREFAMHIRSQSHAISEDGHNQPDFKKACKHGETGIQ